MVWKKKIKAGVLSKDILLCLDFRISDLHFDFMSFFMDFIVVVG